MSELRDATHDALYDVRDALRRASDVAGRAADAVFGIADLDDVRRTLPLAIESALTAVEEAISELLENDHV